MTLSEFKLFVEENGWGSIAFPPYFKVNEQCFDIYCDDELIGQDKVEADQTDIDVLLKRKLEFDREEIVSVLEQGEIPNKINTNMDRRIRQEITSRFNMWSLVDLEWTGKLAGVLDNSRCLEICAGKGWLSNALHHYGVSCIATDKSPMKQHSKNSKYKLCDIKVTHVEEIEALSALDKYCDEVNTIVCSWPPHSSESKCVLAEVIERIKDKQYQIDTIIYVGEDDGGCTGSPMLWDLIKVDRIIDIPAWDMIHDSCYIMSIN